MTELHTSKSHQDGSVQSLLAQIDAEYHAASLGLTGLALGTSRHDFINHRMERIEVARQGLVSLLGEDTAGRLIVEQLNNSADKHKGEK